MAPQMLVHHPQAVPRPCSSRCPSLPPGTAINVSTVKSSAPSNRKLPPSTGISARCQACRLSQRMQSRAYPSRICIVCPVARVAVAHALSQVTTCTMTYHTRHQRQRTHIVPSPGTLSAPPCRSALSKHVNKAHPTQRHKTRAAAYPYMLEPKWRPTPVCITSLLRLHAL